jgi:membrane-associated phospholipid phosphatase
LLACLAIAVGFLLLYDATNWLAHHRKTTRCLAFPWEFHIPRLTPFVVPYWSIDILLVAAPLATRHHQQLATLLRRLAFALLLSCSIFLLWPCRCGFPRSIPDDWTAPLFTLLHSLDLPYNQTPSLHVSEAIIIAPVFLARLQRPWKSWATLWLATGCAATLLTHQHHLADLITGALTGWLALHCFPQKTEDRA